MSNIGNIKCSNGLRNHNSINYYFDNKLSNTIYNARYYQYYLSRKCLVLMVFMTRKVSSNYLNQNFCVF